MAPGHERRPSERHAAQVAHEPASGAYEGAPQVPHPAFAIAHRSPLRPPDRGQPLVHRGRGGRAQPARDRAGRPGAQVLRVAGARHPPYRDPQGGHRGGWEPGAGQGRQEQGGRAVPAGRVRHRVRRRHLEPGVHPRPRDRARDRPEVRLVLLIWRRAAGPGPQQREGLPARASRGGGRDRAQDLRDAGGGAGRGAAGGGPAGGGRGGGGNRTGCLGTRGAGRLRDREGERAIQLGYRAVGYRARTVAELRTFLERKRVEPEAIADAVEELTAAGLLDDARFARRFAEDKRELERWGTERIARDLHRRGIAPDLIERVVSDRTHEAELATALLLLEQRMPAPRDDRERDRAWRLFVRRSYDAEIAYEAVRRHESGGGGARPPARGSSPGVTR